MCRLSVVVVQSVIIGVVRVVHHVCTKQEGYRVYLSGVGRCLFWFCVFSSGCASGATCRVSLICFDQLCGLRKCVLSLPQFNQEYEVWCHVC